MSLSTYSDIKTSVASYLNRSDLTSTIPDFIALTENRLDRELRARVNMIRVQTTTAADTAFYDLPSDLIELRNVTYETSNSNSHALSYLSPESGSREYGTTGSGAPRAYTNLGKNIEIFPTPDGAYTLGLNYFKKLVPLSDSVTTNDILAAFPDLYLFGSCLEGAIYLNDSEQTARFMQIYKGALTEAKAAEDAARFSGTVMQMTVQGDPGSLVRRGV